jgi:MYXO-CTERM domain-containing protein
LDDGHPTKVPRFLGALLARWNAVDSGLGEGVGSKRFCVAAVVPVLVWMIPSTVEAALTEWEYVTPYEIEENSGGALTGVQVELSVDTQTLVSGGELRADGADMRFAYDCAGDQLIDFWIDPGTMNTGATRVWVAVDLAANQTLLVRMFHGNPAAAAASNLDAVFDGPYSATQQITGGTLNNNPGASQRGIRFTPQRDVLVTELGKYEPNGTQRYIGLWDFGAGSILRQEHVGGAANLYSYDSLVEPVWLAAGAPYLLTIFQGAADGYYYQQSSQIAPHLTYHDQRYCNSCTQNTFPTDVLSNLHYGYPDLNYYIKQEPGFPPSAALAAGCQEDASCDADCSAAECGDGVTNASAGEECDDGGLIDGDGCSSSCLIEGGAETSTSSGTGTATGDPTGGDATGGDSSGPGVVSASEGPGSDGSESGDDTATSGSAATAGLPFDPTGGLGRTGCSCRTSSPHAAFLTLLLLAARRRRRGRRRSHRFERRA